MNKVELPSSLNRVGTVGPVAGTLGLVVCLVLALVSGKDQFFQSYLVAFIFWFGLALGSLAALMLHHMVVGRWGFVTQRVMEAGSRTLPLMFLLFLPILFFGIPTLYPWARGPVSEIVSHKQLYLNLPFFTARAFAYFAIWISLAHFLNKWSLELDTTGDARISQKYKWVAGPGIVIYVVTLTFAATDWAMSLEPKWFSTIYGPLFVVGQGLSVWAFLIIIMSLLVSQASPPKRNYELGRMNPEEKPVSAVSSVIRHPSSLSNVMTPDRFHDLGKLLLAFTVLWAYMSFSQLLITWAGNLPEEIHYYLPRFGGQLKAVFAVLVIFHFFVPFFILLSRQIKRVPRYLRWVAGFILGMRLVDLAWVITPAFHPNQFRVHPMDFAALIGIGGLWLGYFVYQLKKRPLLPLHDPRLDEAFAHDQALDHA